MLEAGDEEPLISDIPGMFSLTWGSNMDYAYQTLPERSACAGGRCYWPRGKGMGGSSSIHGMMYARGTKYDYDNWAKLGNDGWSYTDVLPFFKKSENLKSKVSIHQICISVRNHNTIKILKILLSS